MKSWTMTSGPHELDVCLYMAQAQTRKTGYRAHCYDIAINYRREYPDMAQDYLPVERE